MITEYIPPYYKKAAQESYTRLRKFHEREVKRLKHERDFAWGIVRFLIALIVVLIFLIIFISTAHCQSFLITWHPIQDADSYIIERALWPDMQYEQIAAIQDTFYQDAAVEYNRRYYYRIFALNGELVSVSSNIVSGMELDWSYGLPTHALERQHFYWGINDSILLIVRQAKAPWKIHWVYGIGAETVRGACLLDVDANGVINIQDLVYWANMYARESTREFK